MRNQSGRSMIEILGVLAIIGVLSIGGVATFQYAMTKDKANKLIYDINLLREQTLTNAADVPAENFEPESGYQMSSQYGEGGIVSIMIDDLDQDVCERLLSMRFEDLRFLHAEQNTDILSCEGTPSFRAVFGLGDNAIIDEDACVIPCEDNHECHERRCCPKLTEGQCSATASGCPTQVADDGTPCGTNQVCDDGECVCGLECGGEFVPNSACDACECGLECDNGGTPNESCTACENCANSYGGTYCDVCEQNCQNSGTPIQNCSACDCVEPWDGTDCTTCTLTEDDCKGGMLLNPITCSCECSLTVDDCKNEKYLDDEHCLCRCEDEAYTGYSCGYSCPGGVVGGYVAGLSKSACEACNNSFYINGLCYDCEYNNFSFETENEAAECVTSCIKSGVERYQVGTHCSLSTPEKICSRSSTGRTVLSKSICDGCSYSFWEGGYCYGCEYSSSVSFKTEADAEACANACSGKRYQSGNSCNLVTNTSCPLATTSKSGTSKSVCEACANAFWKNGTCYGCGYSSGVSYSTEAEAEACENACVGSGYNRIAEGTYCHIPTNINCPSVTSYTSNMSKSTCEDCRDENGNPMTFWKDGTCYGCGRNILVTFNTEAEAEACENACVGTGYERYQTGKLCYRAANTACPSLTSSTPMSKSTCEDCRDENGNPMTFWKDDTCYGCGSSKNVSFSSDAELEACLTSCSGERYPAFSSLGGGSCKLISNTACPLITSLTTGISKTSCEACGNGYVWTSLASCVGCGSATSLSFSTLAEAEACVAACADSGYPREIDKADDVYYCNLK